MTEIQNVFPCYFPAFILEKYRVISRIHWGTGCVNAVKRYVSLLFDEFTL